MTTAKKASRTIRDGSFREDRVTIEDAEGDGRRFYVEVAESTRNCWITLTRYKLRHLHAAIGALLKETDGDAR